MVALLTFFLFFTTVFSQARGFGAEKGGQSARDTVKILLRLDFQDGFPDDLKNDLSFRDALLSGFKQLGKRQDKVFRLINEDDHPVLPDFILSFSIFNFAVGNEKSDKSMRFAEVKNIRTVFDRDAGEHKRDDIDYAADVTHVKNSVDCSISVLMMIRRFTDSSRLFNKVFNERFFWENEYVTYKGDKQALSEKEVQLSKNRQKNTPGQKILFGELMKIANNDISAELGVFFHGEKGF